MPAANTPRIWAKHNKILSERKLKARRVVKFQQAGFLLHELAARTPRTKIGKNS
jgi:hypothetical protein